MKGTPLPTALLLPFLLIACATGYESRQLHSSYPYPLIQGLGEQEPGQQDPGQPGLRPGSTPQGPDPRVQWPTGSGSQTYLPDQRDDTSLQGDDEEDRLLVGGMWIPLLSIKPDVDEDEPNLGLGFDADLEDGAGYGVQAGIEGEYGTMRGTFVTTEHREHNLGGRARTGLIIAEMNMRVIQSDPRPVQAYFEFGGGLGAAWIDFDRNYSDLWGGAAQVQAHAGLKLGTASKLEAGFAGFMLGYPGETIGYGGYFTLGGSLVF